MNGWSMDIGSCKNKITIIQKITLCSQINMSLTIYINRGLQIDIASVASSESVVKHLGKFLTQLGLTPS